MKQYFAKYLPVEGEPDKEDMIFIEKGMLFHSNVPFYQHQSSPDIYQKVKLFLCSRDIVRNDNVYCSVEDYINRSPLLVQEHAIKALKHKEVFKVIGEISPEATWVKEGDEFDENYILGYIAEDGSSYPLDIIGEQLVVSSESIDYYQIKGPCGHFH